jgi:hypothetical protein
MDNTYRTSLTSVSMTVTEQNCTTQMFARQLWTSIGNFINLKNVSRRTDKRNLHIRFFLFSKQRLELKSPTVGVNTAHDSHYNFPTKRSFCALSATQNVKARTIHITLQPLTACAVGNPRHTYRHKVPSSGESFTNFRYCNALIAR